MATIHISAGRIAALAVSATLLAAAFATHHASPGALPLAAQPAGPDHDDDDVPVGWDGRPVSRAAAASAIAAAFGDRSYAPGSSAQLTLDARAPRGTVVQLFRAGYGHEGVMQGSEIGWPHAVGSATRLRLWLGVWPSGLYYARLTAPGRLGYAPFVLRPQRIGEHHVAVVLPTNTWQAYNFRDDDHDGRPNTWYADRSITEIRIDRPFLGNGVPPHYVYDRAFQRWLALTGKTVDVLTDDDLDRLSGERLARAYRLLVFPGHHEYVTGREYAAVSRFRDLGGNLAFLSANNFFREVQRSGNRLLLRRTFRQTGRPEAALVGVQYRDWNHYGCATKRFTVTAGRRGAWLFRGTGLRDGSLFGAYGIEIDARAEQTPPGTLVLARIPHAFGQAAPAEMTYYETPGGARVFAAGVINFGSSALWPGSRRLLQNLWARLVRA